jgi:phosphoglycolate phosphatase-like HAD superfamily hydrolase
VFRFRWATEAVSDSVVQAVLNAWEMERHHAAERHLYPEMVDVLRQIKQRHPDVIIGAVTDGKANPLFMTFTLAPFFDFCMSWEDDQCAAKREQFFVELNSVEGNAQLRWIYDAAVDKYQDLAKSKAAMKAVKPEEAGSGDSQEPDGATVAPPKPDVLKDGKVWIHVGDDLAYDVGGSATSGARTIYCELADQYGQTARQRFDHLDDFDNAEMNPMPSNKNEDSSEAVSQSQPSWSTTMRDELEKRKIMNEAAKDSVDVKINFLTRLPEAIQQILEGSIPPKTK